LTSYLKAVPTTSLLWTHIKNPTVVVGYLYHHSAT